MLYVKKSHFFKVAFQAAGGGLEPPLPGPEPGVLPLDDPAINFLVR